MIKPSLGIVCNAYKEKYAMPGWLKMATGGFFDDVCVVSSPPAGAKPDEETIELVKQSGVRVVHTTIEAGFGVVRTRCIRESQAEFVWISDADERFFTTVPLLSCDGEEKFPEFPNPNLKVRKHQDIFDQGAYLREMLANIGGADALRMSRRHWFCAPGEFDRPCQNWQLREDWQLRLVRNNQFICYDPDVRMHERLVNCKTWGEPNWKSGDVAKGPFIDHFHCYYKPMEPENNREDAETYERLDRGVTSDMWLNGAAGVKS